MLSTERLTLDPLTYSDAEFIVELLTDPDWLRYIGDRGVRTVHDARGYLENGPMASYATNGFGLYRVSLRESGVPIGMCGLLKRDALPDVDIGFAFLPAYRGQGYAFEAAAAIVADARDRLGMTRILAIVTPGNVGSIRVLQKLGMSQDGIVRMQAGGDALCLFVTRAETLIKVHD
ncbi:GNAT family N-acetyltransferase [Gemmatimonas groenlandica]|uniref:GNAT family N-acetyltransferase n=1 Tax=Gemmatimonas groenlandica TaxID=2732249 RepID=A0A6M4IS18_9BACT|nr:GNAT family N-acetyltransferase [Gemmatimonas groenlandica]QJR36539.1 GNAT family N-acetyltransferase [Gemmatimonas groenlandica]